MFDDAILNAFVSLVLVVGVMGLLLFLLKKYIKKHKKYKNNISLDIISRTSLSPKNQLYVVKVEGKTLLLGATEQNLTTLAVLGEDNHGDNYGVIDGVNRQNLNRRTTAPKQQVTPKIAASVGADDDSLSFGSFLKQSFKKQNN